MQVLGHMCPDHFRDDDELREIELDFSQLVDSFGTDEDTTPSEPDELVELEEFDISPQGPLFGPLADDDVAKPDFEEATVFDKRGSTVPPPLWSDEEPVVPEATSSHEPTKKKAGKFSSLKDRISEAKAGSTDNSSDDRDLSGDYDIEESDGGGGDPPIFTPPPVSEDDPFEFSFDDDDEEEAQLPDTSDMGFIEKLKLGYRQSRDKKQNKEFATAGVDASAPTFMERAIDKVKNFRKSESTNVDDEASLAAQEKASRFAELLQPLSETQLKMLQSEVAMEEPLFVRIERSRRLGHTRQSVSFFFGIVVIIGWLADVGKQFLTEILPHAQHPTWLPTSIPYETASAGLFAVGLLVPFLCVILVADTIHYMWRGIADRRLDDILMSILAGLCTLVALVSLKYGLVAVSLGMVGSWLMSRSLVRWANKKLSRDGNDG